MTLEEQVKLLKSLVFQQTRLLAYIVQEVAHNPDTGRASAERLVEEFNRLNKIVEERG